MNSLLMPFGFLISLALGLAVFGVTGSLDRRTLEQAERQRLELSLNVHAASFRGNLEKHRQGAVLTARHPGVIALVAQPQSDEGQRVAKQLYALTDIDALMILDSDGTPILMEPVRATLDQSVPAVAEAIQFAQAGSLGRALVGNDYLFAAPVFKDREVIGIAVSRFDLGEATSPLDLSTDEIRLLDFDGTELYANFRAGSKVGVELCPVKIQQPNFVRRQVQRRGCFPQIKATHGYTNDLSVLEDGCRKEIIVANQRAPQAPRLRELDRLRHGWNRLVQGGPNRLHQDRRAIAVQDHERVNVGQGIKLLGDALPLIALGLRDEGNDTGMSCC